MIFPLSFILLLLSFFSFLYLSLCIFPYVMLAGGENSRAAAGLLVTRGAIWRTATLYYTLFLHLGPIMLSVGQAPPVRKVCRRMILPISNYMYLSLTDYTYKEMAALTTWNPGILFLNLLASYLDKGRSTIILSDMGTSHPEGA